MFGLSSTLVPLLLIVSAKSLLFSVESLRRHGVSECAFRSLYPELGFASPVLFLQMVLSRLWLYLIGSSLVRNGMFL